MSLTSAVEQNPAAWRLFSSGELEVGAAWQPGAARTGLCSPHPSSFMSVNVSRLAHGVLKEAAHTQRDL